jgi:hypothetical protein
MKISRFYEKLMLTTCGYDEYSCAKNAFLNAMDWLLPHVWIFAE